MHVTSLLPTLSVNNMGIAKYACANPTTVADPKFQMQ